MSCGLLASVLYYPTCSLECFVLWDVSCCLPVGVMDCFAHNCLSVFSVCIDAHINNIAAYINNIHRMTDPLYAYGWVLSYYMN